jgi:hypothetical protein
MSSDGLVSPFPGQTQNPVNNGVTLGFKLGRTMCTFILTPFATAGVAPSEGMELTALCHIEWNSPRGIFNGSNSWCSCTRSVFA